MMSPVTDDRDVDKTQPDPPEVPETAGHKAAAYAAGPRKPPKAYEGSTLPNAAVVINVTREMTQPLLTPPPVQASDSDSEPALPARPGRSQKDIATFVSRPKTDSQPDVPAAKRSLVIVVGFAVGVLFVGLAAIAAVMGGGKKGETAGSGSAAVTATPVETAAATAFATAAATATATAPATAPASAAATAPATASAPATAIEPAASAAPAPVVTADPNTGHTKKPAASAAPKASAGKPGNFVEPDRTF